MSAQDKFIITFLMFIFFAILLFQQQKIYDLLNDPMYQHCAVRTNVGNERYKE